MLRKEGETMSGGRKSLLANGGGAAASSGFRKIGNNCGGVGRTKISFSYSRQLAAGRILGVLIILTIVTGSYASRILRHTNSKRSSSILNDYSRPASSSSLFKEQHQQQINGKYLNSHENGVSSSFQQGTSGGAVGGGQDDKIDSGATLFSSSVVPSLLPHNSPQTLTLTADKNKTKEEHISGGVVQSSIDDPATVSEPNPDDTDC
ncbi:uncharacterized protein LOC129741169 [Uranotaenia lowii]|uniref:uncharacterized protein LOC129741169 n=1 Tax=Uranotaenia lowii TaxID=190385 RepID=UPI00247AE9EA|nr:uncharacterized protein LOC129741169 [Uranotaenia lowii]